MKSIVLILILLCMIVHLKGAKILGVFPVPAPSHYILGSALMDGLSKKGHDVTLISPFSPSKNVTYKNIILTGFWEEAERRRKESNLFEREDVNSFVILFFMNKMLLELTEHTLNHSNVQKLIHSNETFDLVIVEQFMNDALKVFALHFRTPLILFSTVGANAWINLLIGNPAPPSYVPALLLSYSSKMSFLERTINSLMYVHTEILNNVYVYPSHKQLAKKYFPNDPDLDDVLYNASLVLVNSHQSTNQPVPYIPNMIDIGGFHVKPPTSLPTDLQKFLDSARHGAIYFSLGSNLQSSSLPIEKRDALLTTFSKLKQKVLWKWEADLQPAHSENIKFGKWFSQQDILAHPNVKLFITHGGLLSTTETIYHGKPVLAIPIFGDQKLNAQNILNNGYGLFLNYKDITAELLMEKLSELLTNPSYTEEAKKRSEIFHDRLVTPMDTAVYWVEYVIRHQGSTHLKVDGLKLSWYQYFLLDVIVFLLVSIIFLIYFCYTCLNLIIYFCCRRRGNKLKIT